MITDVAVNVFWILVFPGLLFTLVLGLFASWLVRKVSALVQYRVGPPLLQPGWDILKLMGKEVLIPVEAQRTVFVSAPLVGMAGVLLLSTMLWHIAVWPGRVFVGDVIVAVYLMVLPSLALILGGSSSASPHAAVGAGREMKLILGYELPLILALIVAIIKSGGSLDLATLSQTTTVASISGLLAFLVALLCVQAKLGFVPFDIAESETELAGGVVIEYSGVLLAVWKMMQAMMLVALPLFLVMTFLGGFGTTVGSWIWGAVKYVIVIVLVILIKNTNPRVKIDQAMRFFWVYCTILTAIAVLLAMVGDRYDLAWL